MALGILIRSLLPARISNLSNFSTIACQSVSRDHIYNSCKNPVLVNYIQSRGAARKGKRIQRAREARLRANARRLKEAQTPKAKKEFKKSVKVDKDQFRFLSARQLDLTLPNPPEDNVYFVDRYRHKRFSFDEIIEFHRQVVHPDSLNQPDTLVTAIVELNLKMKIKRKKYIENIDSTLCYPHLFQYDLRPRKIVALCKSEADQLAAKDAGAVIAGAQDVAILLKTKQLTQRDFDHIVCHTDYLAEFASIKGMKGAGYFPSKQRGNFGDNIVDLVKYFKNGIDYSLKKNPLEPEFGFIECHFGRLNMSNAQLLENLIALFQSINRFKPLNLADDKQFFERVMIKTRARDEMFLLRFWELYEEYQDPDVIREQLEEEKKIANA